MRSLLLLVFIAASQLCFGQNEKVIVITDQFDSKVSIAKDSYLFHDANGTVTIDELGGGRHEAAFERIRSDKQDLGFTNDVYWIRFKIHYEGAEPKSLYLEAARPVTNIAELYAPDKTGSYRKQVSGDGVPFIQKQIKHRNTLFHIDLIPKHTLTFYMKVGSDGEALNLPLVLWAPEELRNQEYNSQYILGIYYGILSFVFLIYFFFYARLGEKSFLYYVMYVAGIFLLQFSLDGFTTQYLFDETPWLANRSVLWSASFAFIFLMLYVRNFLQLDSCLRSVGKVMKVMVYIAAVLIVFTCFNGKLYEITFPLINLISLAGTLLVVATIILMWTRKQKVDPFFSLAFIFLTAGVFIFILNNLNLVPSNFFTDYGMKLGTALEVICLSFSMANKFRELQKAKEKAQAIALEKLEEMNRLKDEVNIRLEEQVEERTREIMLQKAIIEEKNKDILSSIKYAQRIQSAILPDNTRLEKIFPDSFILYLPKDIVSGDFYWFNEKDHEVIVAAADCTGHGVPGAFMSMIGNSFLNQIVNERQVMEPGRILNELRTGIITSLRQRTGETEAKDGMDIALINVDRSKSMVKYSGAQNPLYLYHRGELLEFKGSKFPIGVFTGELQDFFTHEIPYERGDIAYLFSDGFADQFGGPNGKKFKYRQLKDLIISMADKPMSEQKTILEKSFYAWKGNLEQVDDVCVLGIRL